jgi:hypothetical protein
MLRAGRNLGEFDITSDVKFTKIRLDTRSPGRVSQPLGGIVVFAWMASWIPLLIEAPTC